MKAICINSLLLPLGIAGTVFLFACKKSDPQPTPPVVTTPKDTIPVDPALQNTMGFFMDRWQPKNFTIPSASIQQPLSSNAATVMVTVNTGSVLTKIAPNYFGNNSNLWCGQLNSQPALMNHLLNFKPGIIRGPAGSVSDVFFFNANNAAAPADAPATLLKADGTSSAAGYWYGMNNESWTFSIDGYYNMLQQTNSVGLLTVNYGYARYGTGPDPVAAAAHLAADWVRYDAGRTIYWEVGNECFGDWEAGYRINTATNHDGQPEIITGALYGRHFKVFADSMRNAALETGVPIKIAAVLYDSEPQAWNSNTIKTWNSGYFSEAGNTADYYAVHNYFTPYQENSTKATIFNSAATIPAAVKNYVMAGITTAGLQVKPVAMTEWNLFCSGSKQNVSAVAGIHAVLTMAEFLKNGFGAALRWDLANRWDNGDDHGLFSYGDEPGVSAWSPRPAFYYIYYFQHCTGDRLLSSTVTGSTDIVSTATSFSSGQKGVVLVNKGATSKTVAINFKYFTPGAKFYYYSLKPGTDNDDFSGSVLVNGNGPVSNLPGGPVANYASINMYATDATDGVKVDLPAGAVIFMVVDKK